MKVKDLIKLLKAYDGNRDIEVMGFKQHRGCGDWEAWHSDRVNLYEENGDLYLEGDLYD